MIRLPIEYVYNLTSLVTYFTVILAAILKTYDNNFAMRSNKKKHGKALVEAGKHFD